MNLHELGEIEVIQRLERLLPQADARLRVGIGDDTAVWLDEAPGMELLLTSDSVVEAVHFRVNEEPERIGHKALARTLSDIAAMGGTPGTVLVNVMAPGELAIEELEQVYRGLADCAGRWGVSVAGGDVVSSSVFALHVFAVGYCPKGTALLRSGARVGDALYVTGALGGSILGRHLDFEPRLVEGQWLRAGGWASAAIDLSDGLATDLRHMLKASRVGARLYPGGLPISEMARRSDKGLQPWQHALFDGEDYELLFTVPKEKQLDFERAWGKEFKLGIACIGQMTPDREAIELHHPDGSIGPLEPKAYEHFS